MYSSHLFSPSEPTGGETLLFDSYKIPGRCLSSPYIMLYSAAAYLKMSPPAAWCVRLMVAAPTTVNGLERELLWYNTLESCLFIEECMNLRVLNIILYLQCRDCHCAEGLMLYPVLRHVTQHSIKLPVLFLLFSFTSPFTFTKFWFLCNSLRRNY